jgi:hypothetical protein
MVAGSATVGEAVSVCAITAGAAATPSTDDSSTVGRIEVFMDESLDEWCNRLAATQGQLGARVIVPIFPQT